MRSDDTTRQSSSGSERGANLARPEQQGGSSVSLSGNQRLERRNTQSTTSAEGVDTQQSTPLSPGTRAPDFTLHTAPDQEVSLSDFKGRRLILVFYPADWSPVCGDELAIFNQVLPEFHQHNAEVLGISVDGVWCHIAYAKYHKIQFPLLSDFEPKGEVARCYGAYREKDGVCERALFLIDEQGTICWSYVSPIGVNPGADGIFDALEELDNQKQQRGAAA